LRYFSGGGPDWRRFLVLCSYISVMKSVLSSAILVLVLASHPLWSSGNPATNQIPRSPLHGEFRIIPFAFYTPETSVALGAVPMYVFRLGDEDLRPSTINAILIATVKAQFTGTIVGDFWFPGGDEFRVQLTGLRYPGEFFGIGNDNRPDASESYLQYEARGVFEYNHFFMPSLSVGARAEFSGYETADIESGRLLASGSIPGWSGSFVSGFGLALAWDTRDNVFSAREGVWFQTALTRYDGIFGSGREYSHFVLDLRGYGTLAGRHTFAGQLLAEIQDGDVPFHRLAGLGGSKLLRGAFEGRLRDKALLAAQFEYRLHLSDRWTVNAFGHTGTVASEAGLLSTGDLHFGAGFGARYIFLPRERLAFRLDIAWTAGDFGFYFLSLEAF